MKYTVGLSTAQKIVDHKARGINVVGDWIYFGIPDANTINKVRTDGTMLQTIVSGRVDEELLYVADHYLFYKEYIKTSASEMDNYLIKMDLDTGETVRLLNDAYLFWGDRDYIYYINSNDDQTTYCIDLNGNFVSTYPVRMKHFKYYGARMFSGLLEYYSDGSKQTLMENATNLGASFVDSTYVSPYYRCLPDGTGCEELKKAMYPN